MTNDTVIPSITRIDAKPICLGIHLNKKPPDWGKECVDQCRSVGSYSTSNLVYEKDCKSVFWLINSIKVWIKTSESMCLSNFSFTGKEGSVRHMGPYLLVDREAIRCGFRKNFTRIFRFCVVLYGPVFCECESCDSVHKLLSAIKD